MSADTQTSTWVARAECNALSCRTEHELPTTEHATEDEVRAAFEAIGWRVTPTICPAHAEKAKHGGCLFSDTNLGWGEWEGIDGPVMLCLTHGYPCGDGKAYDGDPTSRCTGSLGAA